MSGKRSRCTGEGRAHDLAFGNLTASAPVQEPSGESPSPSAPSDLPSVRGERLIGDVSQDSLRPRSQRGTVRRTRRGSGVRTPVKCGLSYDPNPGGTCEALMDTGAKRAGRCARGRGVGGGVQGRRAGEGVDKGRGRGRGDIDKEQRKEGMRLGERMGR